MTLADLVEILRALLQIPLDLIRGEVALRDVAVLGVLVGAVLALVGVLVIQLVPPRKGG